MYISLIMSIEIHVGRGSRGRSDGLSIPKGQLEVWNCANFGFFPYLPEAPTESPIQAIFQVSPYLPTNCTVCSLYLPASLPTHLPKIPRYLPTVQKR